MSPTATAPNAMTDVSFVAYMIPAQRPAAAAHPHDGFRT
jgi:hypothetical protein